MNKNNITAQINLNLAKKNDYKTKYDGITLEIDKNNKLVEKNNDPQNNNYYHAQNNQNNVKIYTNQKDYNNYNIIQKSDDATQNLYEYFDNSFYSSGTNFIVFSNMLTIFFILFILGLIFITY